MANNLTLAAIRARIAQEENKNTNNYNNNLTYRFWDMKPSQTAVVRFLPDADPKNIDSFWAEKQVLKFPFNGIVGGHNKPVYVTVPCVDMWKSDYPQGCPVRSQITPWYELAKQTNDEDLKKKANLYWKKYSYIMQGFVRTNPIAEDLANLPENPVRIFNVNKQIKNLITAGMADPEFGDYSPTDYDHGTDFRITQTRKGEYADYSTSKFSRNESPLTTEELESIDKYGLNVLSDFLGKKPSPEELNAICEMFQASVDGEAYDPARWGKFYRPAGVKADGTVESGSTTTENDEEVVQTAKTVAAPKAPATPVVTKEETTSTAAKATSADILAMIRNRNKTADQK